MVFINRGRVNIVITNRVLRYSFNKNNSMDGLMEHGEMELPNDTIKDGAIENEPVLLEMVNKLVHKYKWKRKKLYFCLPDDTVVIRDLQIPAMLSKEEATGYVKTQIGNSFYLPFANPSIAIEFLETEKEIQHIRLFAYPKDKISAFENLFEKAGLKPAVADLTSLSVYRYYYLHNENRKDHVLSIHWNTDSLLLTAFKKDKAIFTRYLKTLIHYDSDPEGMKQGTAQQHIKDYIIEIRRIIDFYRFSITNGESQINSLLLSGDFPFIDLVKTELEETELSIYNFNENEMSVKYVDVLGLALKKDI